MSHHHVVQLLPPPAWRLGWLLGVSGGIRGQQAGTQKQKGPSGLASKDAAQQPLRCSARFELAWLPGACAGPGLHRPRPPLLVWHPGPGGDRRREQRWAENNNIFSGWGCRLVEERVVHVATEASRSRAGGASQDGRCTFLGRRALVRPQHAARAAAPAPSRHALLGGHNVHKIDSGPHASVPPPAGNCAAHAAPPLLKSRPTHPDGTSAARPLSRTTFLLQGLCPRAPTPPRPHAPLCPGTLIKLLCDQFCFAPVFISTILGILMTLEGSAAEVPAKLKQVGGAALGCVLFCVLCGARGLAAAPAGL